MKAGMLSGRGERVAGWEVGLRVSSEFPVGSVRQLAARLTPTEVKIP